MDNLLHLLNTAQRAKGFTNRCITTLPLGRRWKSLCIWVVRLTTFFRQHKNLQGLINHEQSNIWLFADISSGLCVDVITVNRQAFKQIIEISEKMTLLVKAPVLLTRFKVYEE